MVRCQEQRERTEDDPEQALADDVGDGSALRETIEAVSEAQGGIENEGRDEHVDPQVLVHRRVKIASPAVAKKKAAKKKRPQDAEFDPNQRRRERLDARRQAKAEALAARQRAERREKLIRRVALVALLGAAVWFLFLRNTSPSEIGGHAIENVGSFGIGDHVAGTVNYDHTPPVSGEHAQSAAACGVQAQQIPNENFVHTMEHGVVGVLYDPAQVEPDEIREIEALVSDFESHTVSAPYAGMETPIAVTAWAHIMRLDSLDEPAVREFIDEFRQQGPEDQPCPNTAETPFPTESPGGDATPGAELTPPPGDEEESPNDAEDASPSPTG